MPLSTERFRRLARAVRPSYNALKPFREAATSIQNQYLGPHYGKVSTDERPINMMEMALTLHVNELSSANPQVLCLTHSQELKAAAREKQLALNETLKRMDFAGEHRLWVMSALIGWGILQVGLETTDRRMVDEEMLPTTNVFVETIPLDDWVHDQSAKKWGNQQVKFCGHRYSVSLKWAKSNPDFDPEVRARLVARDKPLDNTMEAASRGAETMTDMFVDMVDLWSLWVPPEEDSEPGYIVTCSASENGQSADAKPLRVVEWTGPEHGPYHRLGFGVVLNNVIELAPATNWQAAEDLTNKLFTRLGNDSAQAKTIGVTGLQGKVDAERVIDSHHGQTICLDNPGQFHLETFGGVDQVMLAFANQMKAITSYIMGNLDSQAGLGQEASTLGQEQIIKSSASGRMRAMQEIVATATRKVISDIAFYLHKHPVDQMNLTLELPGNSKLPITWPMQQDENGIEFDSREGEVDEYQIDIVPYSMTSLPPGARAQLLERIYMQIILPIVSSGMPPPEGLDVLLAKLAEYYSLPELTEIYKPSAQPPQQPMSGGHGGGIRPPTNSTYTRKSVAAPMSQQKMDQQMQLAMMGGGGALNNAKSGAV